MAGLINNQFGYQQQGLYSICCFFPISRHDHHQYAQEDGQAELARVAGYAARLFGYLQEYSYSSHS